MTFAHYDIAEGAQPLHEHQHEQEEVWHIVDGQVALSIGGHESIVSAGSVAIVPPNTPHSVRASRSLSSDHRRLPAPAQSSGPAAVEHERSDP
jgi:mannose-6-phosphate isomerase-like protein (cupin superfamily)